MTEVPFLNLLAASWIQFMNHDWVNHGEILLDDVIEVPLPAGRPGAQSLPAEQDGHRQDPA